MIDPLGPLIFGTFLPPPPATKQVKKPTSQYQEMTDMNQLVSIVTDQLADYNATSPAPMALVLFQNAVEHIARILRVIQQPFGNALLMGVGGSGRKSLTTLAVHLAPGFGLFQIEITKGRCTVSNRYIFTYSSYSNVIQIFKYYSYIQMFFIYLHIQLLFKYIFIYSNIHLTIIKSYPKRMARTSGVKTSSEYYAVRVETIKRRFFSLVIRILSTKVFWKT